MSEFLGILREPVFSPGKVVADRAILEAVATFLRDRGHAVRVASLDAAVPQPPHGTVVFAMSQGERALATLRRWEADGIRVVNSVDSILDCHRHRLIDRLQRAGVLVPDTASFTLAQTAPPTAWPEWLRSDGGWIKRGDVHATHADDVTFVRDTDAAADAATRFRARGITSAVVQRHVEGAVIKFYGVRGGFLSCFPASRAQCEVVPGITDELRMVADAASDAVGLEVYGGDCVATKKGDLQLIDLNDWPSYEPCRAEGARAIAALLEALSFGEDT
jgi:hypothetical protein